MDLIYFGHDHTPYIEEFKAELLDKLPNVIIENANDEIKGYRLAIHEFQDEEYYPWLIAFGWYEFSLGFLSSRKVEKDAYIELAKQKYPQNFKTCIE